MAVGPATLERLDEALGLAVGLGGVGPREALADAVVVAESLEDLGLGVALGVVREEALAADPKALEPAESSAEEGRGVLAALRREDLGVGQAGVVVDAHEDHLPADASFLAASVSVDPVPHALDPSELLGIDMEEPPRDGMLVALRGIESLLESPQAAESELLELPGDRGDGDAGLEGDLPGGLLAPAELFHAPNRLARSESPRVLRRLV